MVAMPSRSLPIIASSDDSTIAPNGLTTSGFFFLMACTAALMVILRNPKHLVRSEHYGLQKGDASGFLIGWLILLTKDV